MNLLLESPLAVGAIGLLVVAVAAIFHSQLRTTTTLAGLTLSLLLAIGAVVAERFYQTPAEQVRATVHELFVAIEANDVPGVVATLSPTAAEVRSDAQSLMPLVEVQSAGVGGEVRVELADERHATAHLKPLIKARLRKTDTPGAYFDTLELDLAREGDRWLIEAYRPGEDFGDAVGRLSR